MTRPLRVLIVEDNESDAALLLRELSRAYAPTFLRVETPETMKVALATKQWDVVISDYSMPRFRAPAALALLKETGLDIPFIIVSGTMGEETAVEAMRAGAQDFITKQQLGRLLPVLEREMREVEVRRERRKMEEQLTISDRMASLGTLAAGVAHEINNPLAAVCTNLELAVRDVALLAKRLGPIAELRELEGEVQDAVTAAERMRNIVRDLRVFSRSEEDRRYALDLHRVLDSALRMALNEIRHRARVVKDYGEIAPVLGTESRLGQVFLNLIVNAAQAIAEGRADANEIRIRTRLERGRVVVEISDTGPGIPEETLSKLFTPFFTTKQNGVGTGLGLVICQRILAAFGGDIGVRSAVGQGTVARVTLPVAQAERSAPDSVAPAPLTRTRRGRILVVDDEELIRRLNSRVLGIEHEVVMVETGREALARIQAGERFDVVVTDLMMPVMTGMELHAELARYSPHHAERMLFLTGGAFTSQARSFLSKISNPRLEKPFDPQKLRALVNELLSK